MQPQKPKGGCLGRVLQGLGVLFILLVVIAVIGGHGDEGEAAPTKEGAVSSAPENTQKPEETAEPKDTPKPTATSKPTPEPTEEPKPTEKPEETEPPAPTPAVQASFDTTGYLFLDDDMLYEYGPYLVGQKVVTVIAVKDKSSDALKADTAANDSFFFSITCDFSSPASIIGVQEGMRVTVAGTVVESPISGISDTVNLENCALIGLGEIADELAANAAGQRTVCEQVKADQEAEAAAAVQAEKSAYINGCETVSYDAVARNPDSYEGRHIQVRGKVLQVQEGWFNSVTIRLDSNGNTWYITYTRAEGESRILEGDVITAYGECSGVTSYTTVLGSKLTVPSMKMQYYNF